MGIAKELPEEIRPYERCLKLGPQALNDAELLAVILRTGSRGENSLELASRLLSMGSLSDLTSMTVAGLTEVRGIGKIKAIQLQCMAELGLRAVKNHSETPCLNTPEAVAGAYMDRLSAKKQEEVLLLALNGRHRLLKEIELTRGTVNSSLLSPREVFIEALRYNAVKIILIHNHPSGDPSPSREDIEVTQLIVKAGRLLNIPLEDHLIIGGNSFLSLKEMGYLIC